MNLKKKERETERDKVTAGEGEGGKAGVGGSWRVVPRASKAAELVPTSDIISISLFFPLYFLIPGLLCLRSSVAADTL